MNDQFLRRDLPWAIGLVFATSLATALFIRIFLIPESNDNVVIDQPQREVEEVKSEPSNSNSEPKVANDSAPKADPEPKQYHPVVWQPDLDSLPLRQPNPFNGLQNRIAHDVKLPIPTIITWATSRTSTARSGATNKSILSIRCTTKLIALDQCDPQLASKTVTDFLIRDMLSLGHDEGIGDAEVIILYPGGERIRSGARVNFLTKKIEYR